MALRELIGEVEKKLNIGEYYKKQLRGAELSGDKGNQFTAHCPFHDDEKRSFSVNFGSGLWICHAGCGDGNIFQFVQKLEKVDYRGAVLYFAKQLGIDVVSGEKVIPEDVVKKSVGALRKSEETMEYLGTKRGLSRETIEKFELGLCRGRISIPIRNDLGHCVNMRLYKRDAKGVEKMISWKEGYGKIRLFPTENVGKDTILICEGEWDTMVAYQLGYDAITATGGAGAFSSSWVPLFKGKAVWLCYDIDEAGRNGAERVGMMLAPVAREVKDVLLPITEPKDGDLTNYIVDNGYTKADLDKLILQTAMFVVKEKTKAVVDPEIHEVHLSKASLKDYYYKNIRLNVLVAGKDLAPYLIPRKLAVSCSDIGGKACDRCAITRKGGEVGIEFGDRTNEILQLLDCTDEKQRGVIKKKAGVFGQCDKCDIIVQEAMNIEELRVIPEIDFTAEATEYVIRNLFYVGHGLRLNQTYTLDGFTLPDPKTQYATHLITHAKPFQDDVQAFEMSEDIAKELKIFQPAGGQSVAEKFKEIHDDLIHNVTRIYERYDLLTAVDLVYHSVIGMYFMGKALPKAWCECLILGDTRTGKTASISNIIQHYKAGESITGENTSFAGLIGGIQEVSGRFSLVWGKIPLNDRRLVVIDEASALPLEAIERMSGIRSSGIAEIVKIQTERTNARTRLIWVSNPRSPRSLAEYNNGVTAIKELIGRPEDIARFDFAMTVASGEVDLKIINALVHEEVPHRYTSRLCNRLVMWSWSRKRDDIEIGEETVKKALQWADFMGKKYSSAIPIVEAAEQRIKLIRLATAAACRMFSTDETSQKVIVKPEHVDFVGEYLVEMNAKPSLAYDLFSDADSRRKVIPGEDAIVDRFRELSRDVSKTAEGFLAYDLGMLKTDIEDVTGLEGRDAKEFLGFLVREKALSRRGAWYWKSPAFIRLLRRLLKGKEVEKTEEVVKAEKTAKIERVEEFTEDIEEEKEA